MARKHLSPAPKDSRSRRPAEIMSSVGATNHHHSLRDIFIVVSGIGLLKILRSALPKLNVGASATGKQTAAATAHKIPASSRAKAARVSWTDVVKKLYARFSKDRVMAGGARGAVFSLPRILSSNSSFFFLYSFVS